MNIIMNRLSNSVRISTLTKDLFRRSSTNKNNDCDLVHPEGPEISIPPYVERQGENVNVKRARLLYQSRKRGMLENGLLLSTFAAKYLNSFDEKQLQLYDRLINLPSNDWDIFYWATGVKPVPAEFDHEIMDLLKNHIQNKDRQFRIMQPNL